MTGDAAKKLKREREEGRKLRGNRGGEEERGKADVRAKLFRTPPISQLRDTWSQWFAGCMCALFIYKNAGKEVSSQIEYRLKEGHCE